MMRRPLLRDARTFLVLALSIVALALCLRPASREAHAQRQAPTWIGPGPLPGNNAFQNLTPGSALTVTDWYLDGSNSSGNASDSNNCTTSGTPCVNLNQVVARWGQKPAPLGQTTTLHVLSNDSSESVALSVAMTGAFNFNVVGTTTTVQTLTPATLTSKNRSTPQLLQITVTAGQAALAVPGQIVTDTTRGSTATVSAVASTTITLTQPFTTLSSASASRSLTPAEDDGWAVTDSLTFSTKATLNLQSFLFYAGTSASGAGAGVAYFQGVSVPDPSGTAGTSVFSPTTPDGAINIVDCSIAPQFSYNLGSASSAFNGIANAFVLRTVNAWLPGGAQSTGGAKFYGGQTPSIGSEGDNAFDGDMVVTNNFEVFAGVANVEGLYLGTGAFTRVWASGTVRQLTSLVAGFVWGPGLIVLDGGAWANVAGTYAIKVLVPTLRIDVAADTASSYNTATGAWTAAIAVTAANIDSNGSLMSPKTGGRFSSAL